MSNKMKAIDVAERAKIGQLMKESQSASGKDKVDWIYSGNKVDRDAYLLGKPIDKVIQEAEAEQQKQAQSFLTTTVDLSNKIREDPLFEIKKKEIEAKKRLLENPMRLKQIQQMLARKERDAGRDITTERDRATRRDRSTSREKEKHHHKKSKKKKHHRRRSSSNSSRSSSSGSSSRSRTRRRSRSRSRTRSPPRSRGGGGGGRDDTTTTSSTHSKYGLSQTRVRDDESSSDRQRDRPETSAVTSSARREAEEYKKRIERLKDLRSKNEPSSKSSSSSSSVPSKRMTDEEKQQKLREMQENAKWRDDVRSKNMTKYKSEDKKEDETKNTTRDGTGLFNNMMRDSYVSAEDRIRRNRKNVQRGSGRGDDYDESSFVSRR